MVYDETGIQKAQWKCPEGREAKGVRVRLSEKWVREVTLKGR